MRRKSYRFRIAYSSAKEIDTHLQLLIGAGAVNASEATTAVDLFDEVRVLSWRPLHPR